MSDALSQILAYYRDLGIGELYVSRKPLAGARGSVTDKPLAGARGSETRPTETPRVETPLVEMSKPVVPVTPPPPVAPVAPLPIVELPALSPVGDTLELIRADIGDCKRCRLCEARHNIVFGSGNQQSSLVFVGEGPGEDEDMQGLPFVGRAGQLLTAMIENTAKKEGIPLQRPDVYICNVVKCRPPKNRTPEPDEMEMCGQFLFRQLLTIKPKAICTLGATATRALLGRKEGVTKMRGNWYKWRDIPVMVTYHPSFLLRAYNVDAKREAWEDLKTLFHFVYD